ncbi:GNAT family N-acetyltransferase [Desulfovibrio ferrophilus]|uniref:N-acetyltransferase domain-containing protein n=1 Tax=Desulfovibrio ferrophilus TaxID=241368 RepID=A0A2Z6B1N4_9BACT|nr:GNAT family N-acetyltransferase [Desulfovibrio ferrophilus]BBD09350.1 uncharacterized protein DFE_2624 [Desulfovibrio ferrophilus]
MTETELISLSIAADTEYFPTVNFAAKQCATKLGFAPRDADRICLALEEAMANAIKYGYGGTNDRLHISLTRASMGIKIILRSRGLTLDQKHLPQYDPALAHDAQDTTGLSFHLIQKLVDTVSRAVRDDGQITVTMLKQLPLPRPVESEVQQNGKAPRAPKQEVTHSIRRASPEDAEAISRLALRSHGTVMFSEQIYYPERVREMIESGEMTSALVVTDAGVVMGHGALVAQEPGGCIEELTYGVVDSRFRSQGCASKLAEFLMDEATERGVYALQAFAVTSHVHSQRAIEHLEYKECALLLAASPPARHWDDNQGGEPGRIGNLVYVKFLQPPKPLELYVPPRHREMVARLYANMDAPFQFVDAGQGPAPTGPAQLFTLANFAEGWSLIGIQSYGADTATQVRKELDNALSANISSIQLMLPLHDPATATLCTEFEAMGFFFAGVGTGPDRSENLILQYLNGVDAGYDSVHVHSDMAKELVEYVRSCDEGKE